MTNLKWIATSTALATVLILGASSYAQDASQKHDYAGVSQCKLCHNKPDEGKQYSIWKLAEHSQSYTVLLGDRAKEVAKIAGVDGPPNEAASCLSCHVTAYNAETKTHPQKIKKTDGVQCESCHGPGSAHIIDGRKLLMKKDPTINVADKLVPPDGKTCVQCHNDQNPTWNPERYTLDDGSKVGFSFEEAVKSIQHNNPKKAR